MIDRVELSEAQLRENAKSGEPQLATAARQNFQQFRSRILEKKRLTIRRTRKTESEKKRKREKMREREKK